MNAEVHRDLLQSFKLKKKFGDQKEPVDICEQLKAKVDAFSEHLPLIAALCTPGLKDRHWKQISEAIAKVRYHPPHKMQPRE